MNDLRAALIEPDAHPLRWMLDETPCWCISYMEPHVGWLHGPACQTLLRERVAVALAAEAAAPGPLDVERLSTHDTPRDLDVPPGIAERVNRFETGRNDKHDTLYRAATDRTILVGVIRRLQALRAASREAGLEAEDVP